jgi:hypothetical protein
MPIKNELINQLSKTLFWDSDISSIDAEKHKSYIVDRVLSLGTLEDFRLLKAFYGKSKIKRIVKELRYMDERVLHFCSAYFNVPIIKFRCYEQKQLKQTHWNY